MSDRSNPRPYSAATGRRAPTGPVHISDAITAGVPPTVRGSGIPRVGADPNRTGWENPAYDLEANDPELVAVDDDHIEHTVALVEKGAKAEVDRVLLLCGTKLRDGVCLDLIAAALEETAAETRMLAAACARARASRAGVQL